MHANPTEETNILYFKFFSGRSIQVGNNRKSCKKLPDFEYISKGGIRCCIIHFFKIYFTPEMFFHLNDFPKLDNSGNETFILSRSLWVRFFLLVQLLVLCKNLNGKLKSK
uniref:Uncharacterized protein ZK643.7 n=1 Tax=Caenorhabditis elegans TaxID=6239 RepID=YOW7_CAEEL|nr:RecName: Full=Uncharacterized protein ZK643.7 [Caenorhabditis elegans]|eukprot:NP_498976.1 Uncharacterized protein CELE_ZK643.7 [Caenorhabditis elegans]